VKIGIYLSNFARAAFAFLMISASINTAAKADELKRVSANGTVLAYVELGQGEPVIFVHGGLQDYRMWLKHLPKFAGRYHAIAYSRRNNYPNETSPDGCRMGRGSPSGQLRSSELRMPAAKRPLDLCLRTSAALSTLIW
jgi:non-heme chloroperoxidase